MTSTSDSNLTLFKDLAHMRSTSSQLEAELIIRRLWTHLDASQLALGRALHENAVHAEALEIAKAQLRHGSAESNSAIVRIEDRLREMEALP